MKKVIQKTLTILSLNEKGYGLAKDEQGKDCWILNALPNETVLAEIFKRKKGRLIGKAVEILKPSKFRVENKDEHFLSSSPWQIASIEGELEFKKSLINSAFAENQVILPNFEIYSPDDTNSWNYRNKVEFGFYGDENENIFLSFFMRGGNFGKYPLPSGDSLLAEKINQQAIKIVQFLNTQSLKARDLKTLILRYSYYQNKVVASLFIKNPNLKFSESQLKGLVDEDLQGLAVFYSNANSPASIVSQTQLILGEMNLQEKIQDSLIEYSWDNFFQVNIKVFEVCAKEIQAQVLRINPEKKIPVLDMYAGVGTIGLLLKNYTNKIVGVEVFPNSKNQALKNAEINDIKNFDFVETAAEKALEYVSSDQILLLDPPRAGLHQDLIKEILTKKPKDIIYLSCNYQTQAENLNQLQGDYEITFFRGYNFYPHTPHVETLAVLKLK